MNRFAMRMNDRFVGMRRTDRNRQQTATMGTPQTARFWTASPAGWLCANPKVAAIQGSARERNPVELGRVVRAGLQQLPWNTAVLAG